MKDATQRTADYVNGQLKDKLVLSLDPTIVYDYQSLILGNPVCPSCGKSVSWVLMEVPYSNFREQIHSDKFCAAECCGMQYSMVAEKVRIIAVPMAILNKEKEKALANTGNLPESLADAQFLKELREMNLKHGHL